MVIQSDLTKRRHLSAHFGLKYLSNDGINRDRFHCKKFPKYILLGQLKKSRANFEWSASLREQGTNLYGDTGECDEHCGI